MNATRVGIGVIGDFDPESPTHRATNQAIEHAGAALDTEASVTWLPTRSLEQNARQTLERFDGLFCAPGSPYESMDGALGAIRFAREHDRPFIGTCGGFQHVILEYARGALGFEDAAHAEYDPYASTLFVSALECSLAGKKMRVGIQRGSRAFGYYLREEADEEYYCNFGLNPAYRDDLEDSGLTISGRDHDDEPRVVELPAHRFFLATLFVPQTSSAPDRPHPLMLGFLRAARGCRNERRKAEESHVALERK